MCTRVRLLGILASLVAFAALGAGAPLRAEDAATAAWQVSKASGEVWVATEGVQPASLGTAAALKPGDSIRTGRNGRVLLVRGQETILVAPNSAITIPLSQKDAASTTILQQAGSIRLEVEKRPERNFEVETPYLVAAVKGTQFTVTVGQGTAKVDVNHGSVEVADHKSGQIALVMPGQSAKVTTLGQGGLTLGGAGTLNPIRKGEPRAPSVQHLQVPKGGFSVPQGQHVRALGNPAGGQARAGGLHIGALGEVKLDIHRSPTGSRTAMPVRRPATARRRCGARATCCPATASPRPTTRVTTARQRRRRRQRQCGREAARQCRRQRPGARRRHRPGARRRRRARPGRQAMAMAETPMPAATAAATATTAITSATQSRNNVRRHGEQAIRR